MTGWRRLRASDDDFLNAVTEAATVHARDELFAKHITPRLAERRQTTKTTRPCLRCQHRLNLSWSPCLLLRHPHL